jgi:hypothetical protein
MESFFFLDNDYLILFQFFDTLDLKNLKIVCKLWNLYITQLKLWKFFSIKDFKINNNIIPLNDKKNWYKYYEKRKELNENMDESKFLNKLA